MLHISHQYQLIAHPPSAPSVVQLCSLQPLGICWNLSIYHSISRINCFTEMLSYRTCVLLTITIALMSSLVSTLKISRLPIRHNFSIKSTEGGSYSSAETVAAMENARTCAANGLSPGAGLATADEQAEVHRKIILELQIYAPLSIATITTKALQFVWQGCLRGYDQHDNRSERHFIV